ncbi:MAG: hypothetical protein IPL73_06040 [Candidatus Obscuribacter sp.]|nr:hypothetical protein [Candidatus Obscuribacter sp.]
MAFALISASLYRKTGELDGIKRAELIDTAVAEGGKRHKDSEIELERAVQGVKLGITAIQTMHGEEVPMGPTC